MWQRSLLFACLGLGTMSCTLPDPIRGHCGDDDLHLGDVECQCVTPDNEDSEGSVSYKDPELDYLDHCWEEKTSFSKKLNPGDTEIYVCIDRKCAIKPCEDGKVPDKAKRKCVEKVDCSDPKEVYDQEENACQCDATKHFTGKAGSCVCETGYVYRNGACEIKPTCGAHAIYDEEANVCRCEAGFEKSGNQCVASACDGENEIRDNDGACVCDKGYLRFFDHCIREDECQSPRVNNHDGTCTCFGRYTYMYGDCFTVGDSMTLGRYPQNENSSVPSPLTWLILEINDDSALLLSEYVLEQYTYHDQQEDITWEKSNIRSYLNGFDGSHNKNGIDHTGKGFIDIAFTPAERKQIKTVTNTNPDAPSDWNSTPGGNDTEDRVFLLSRDEALKYFSNNESRKARPTAYALHPPTSSGRKNLYTCQITCSNENSCACKEGTWSNNASNVHVCSNVQCGSHWWLRSPGYYPDFAANIRVFGGVYYGSVDDVIIGFRPALYVHLRPEP